MHRPQAFLQIVQIPKSARKKRKTQSDSKAATAVVAGQPWFGLAVTYSIMVGTSGSRASCCEICTSERVISPVLVLSLHGLIVTDVAWHRAELWQDDGLWYRGLRLLVLLTVACYLRTSLTDPGFLQVGGQPANATCCSAQGCMLLCCAAAVSMSEWKGASKEGNPMMLLCCMPS